MIIDCNLCVNILCGLSCLVGLYYMCDCNNCNKNKTQIIIIEPSYDTMRQVSHINIDKIPSYDTINIDTIPSYDTISRADPPSYIK